MVKNNVWRFNGLRKLSFVEQNGIILFVKGTPFSIFVWRDKVYWDNLETEESVSFEEAFDFLPDEIKQEILFNLNLFT